MRWRFEDPWLLLLGLAPLFVWLVSRTQPATHPISSLALLDGVRLSSWGTRLRWLPAILRFLWVSGLVMAMARPQQLEVADLAVEDGRSIFMIVDISGSMGVADIEGGKTRLDRFKTFFERLMADERLLPADQVGLVTLSERPRIICPLTQDHQTVRQRARELEVDRLADRTNIGDAVALAIDQLTRSMSRERRIILFTDGGHNIAEGLSPSDAARVAQAFGIPLDVVDVGPLVDVHDEAGLQRESLRRMAEISGGMLVRAAEGMPETSLWHSITIDAGKVERASTRWRARDLFVEVLAASMALCLAELIARRAVYR